MGLPGVLESFYGYLLVRWNWVGLSYIVQQRLVPSCLWLNSCAMARPQCCILCISVQNTILVLHFQFISRAWRWSVDSLRGNLHTVFPSSGRRLSAILQSVDNELPDVCLRPSSTGTHSSNQRQRLLLKQTHAIGSSSSPRDHQGPSPAISIDRHIARP